VWAQELIRCKKSVTYQFGNEPRTKHEVHSEVPVYSCLAERKCPMDCRNAAKAAAVASPAVTYQEGYHYHRQYRLPAVPLCLDIDYGNCRRSRLMDI
ncbi:unnamed protein product, partial [Callosobruchus maculatus]